MSTGNELSDQLQAMLQKAVRAIVAANRHIAEGDYDFASSRAYYAAFYAMEAVLVTKGLSFSKHSSVISAFNRHFVKTGFFPKEFSKMISRLFRERQAGDYEFGQVIGKEDAEEDVRIAEEVVQAITRHLVQRKFIPPEE